MFFAVKNSCEGTRLNGASTCFVSAKQLLTRGCVQDKKTLPRVAPRPLTAQVLRDTTRVSRRTALWDSSKTVIFVFFVLDATQRYETHSSVWRGGNVAFDVFCPKKNGWGAIPAGISTPSVYTVYPESLPLRCLLPRPPSTTPRPTTSVGASICCR